MAIKVSGTEVISDDKRILNNESLPDIRPSLLLDFANSKTLDPRITFTRGSTATYWDGKTTAKAEENLLQYSQNTTLSPWSGAGTTRTANTVTAPDGTTTGNTIEITTEGPYRNVRVYPVGLPSTTYTASVYLKKSNYDYVRFNMQSRDSSTAFISSIASRAINLSDGSTVGTDEGTATTTSVGNGWYRVTVSGTSASNAEIIFIDAQFVVSAGGGNPTPDIASGSEFYVWGFQLEQRSSATAYTATTTSPIVKYQPVLQTAASGEARFDHDPVTGESKGLLIEEARTNLVTESENFQSWGKLNATVYTADKTEVGPDGQISASKIVQASTTNNAHYIATTAAVTSGTTYTFSAFVKYVDWQYVNLDVSDGAFGSPARATFDLVNGTVTEASSGTDTIEDVGNGWWRISMSVTATATTTASLYISFNESSYVDINFDGDGYSSFHIWGAQLEEGSFPTSYIPTSGSTVTRAADLPLMSGSNFTDWFNDLPFSAYVEYDFQTSAINQRIFSIDTNGYDPRLVAIGSVSSGYGPMVELYAGGNFYTTLTSDATTPTETGTHKLAFAFADNDAANSKDGAAVMTDTSFVFPSNFSQLRIGSQANGANLMQGTIKKLAFYPKRLSNATLQAMTEA